GTVAVISSVAGDRGRGSNHAYGAAKAGLTAFCSGLRARMHARGVHIVTIKPGFIDSPMTAHIAKKGALWASPEAVAKGIVNAIDKKRDVVYLPSFWRVIMLIIAHVPEAIFKRLKF
ncbi:MAG TPA: SDR family NAD(P)-dependent oxidoreductase, partial [Casimicrobium sp.]|nr:SDR family NAD(P)-dependent oxidoreductase [Casimicrobium sp.]